MLLLRQASQNTFNFTLKKALIYMDRKKTSPI